MIPKILTGLLGEYIIMSEDKTVESIEKVDTFISQLKYVIKNNGILEFQEVRKCDKHRNIKFSNKYTINKLFPDEDLVKAIKRELILLKHCDYLHTLKDIKFPNRSLLRVFAKKYSGEYVYIKIRAEVVHKFVHIISFHFSSVGIKENEFTYKEV